MGAWLKMYNNYYNNYYRSSVSKYGNFSFSLNSLVSQTLSCS